MKRFFSVIFILLCACAATAQNLPTKWQCKTNGFEAEQKACINLYNTLIESGFANVISSDDVTEAWFRVDVISQLSPDGESFSMNVIIMMAYPKKWATLLITTYTQLMTAAVADVDNPLIYKILVLDIIVDVGDWARSVGPFIDFCPDTGTRWYKMKKEELPSTT